MTTTRAVVEIPGQSSLPEDTIVNTFHFVHEGSLSAESHDAITTELRKFYSGGAAPVLHSFMAGDTLGSSAPQITYYELDEDGVAGAPSGFGENTLWDPDTVTQALPTELAVCLSFHGALATLPERIALGPSGPEGDTKPRARRRGRVYIGGLNTKVLSAAGTAHSRVSSTFRARLAAAAGDLLTSADLANEGIAWATYSRANDAAYPVVGGWVDDAFDIQRRRGTAASTRNTFGGA